MTAPPPMPCSVRDATSIGIEDATPHSIDPTRKNPIAAWKTALRPKRSPSLPTTAVVMVEASR